MREKAGMKARGPLVEGRVPLLDVSEVNGKVTAEVRGDSALVYEVNHDRADSWACDAAARGVCSHVRVVMLLVVVA